MSSCEQIATCGAGSPFTVQIRPALEMNPEFGPDPSKLIASFTMSHDRDPRTVSFESASFQLPLHKGTYYALFGLPPGEGGDILDSAMFPFPYRAPEAIFGIMDPGVNFSINANLHGAMLITAAPVTPIPEPSHWCCCPELSLRRS